MRQRQGGVAIRIKQYPWLEPWVVNDVGADIHYPSSSVGLADEVFCMNFELNFGIGDILGKSTAVGNIYLPADSRGK